MKKIGFLILLVTLLVACSKSIDPIEYGNDQCDFCRMTIVEPTHAAQVVTNKGRNYKFDASECLIHYLHENGNEKDMLHVLVADLMNAGELFPVEEATFLISPNIPSPMGENLSAIQGREHAVKVMEENGGEIFSWADVKVAVLADFSKAGHN